jgi:hypothetical protein
MDITENKFDVIVKNYRFECAITSKQAVYTRVFSFLLSVGDYTYIKSITSLQVKEIAEF